MKTIRYIVLGMVMVTLSFGSLSGLLAQKGTMAFMETYANSVITSLLEPEDPFYRLVRVNKDDPESSLIGYCDNANLDQCTAYIQNRFFLDRLPGDLRLAWGAEAGDNGTPLYALREQKGRKTGPDGADIEQLEVVSDPPNSHYSLLISFNRSGTEKWARLTGDNVGRDIAIVINDRVWSAPRVRDRINMGKCMITGNFSEKEVIALKDQLEPSR